MTARANDELATTSEVKVHIQRKKENDGGTEIPFSLNVHYNGLPWKELALSDDAISAEVLRKRTNGIDTGQGHHPLFNQLHWHRHHISAKPCHQPSMVI
jgi:hypothetical protein